MNNKLYLIILELGLMAAIRPALGAIVYVSTNGNDTTGGGTTWPDAVATISNGVAKALTDADVVMVSNGTYNLSVQVTIDRGITVQGFAGRDATFVNGQNATRCFYLSNNAAATLDGFTIINGYADRGGGVYIQTNGRVVNCTLASNQSTNSGSGGGAVYLNAGGLLTNCVISNNTANLGMGGGAYLYNGGILSNCTFVANTSSNASFYNGGGAWLYMLVAGRMIRVSGCVFSNNVVPYYGGGLFMYQNAGSADAVLIDNCTFVTNIAANIGKGYGGGVGLEGGGVVSNCTIINNIISPNEGHGAGAYISGGQIVNCTNISGNSAKYGGGGIELNNSRAANCRITGNSSAGFGGGIFQASGAGNSVVTGCVVAGNTANSWGGGLMMWGKGWTVQDCIISNNTSVTEGGGIIAVGPTGLIQRCEIVTNTATKGGGIEVYDTVSSVVQDCVIRGNSATAGNGGGIYYPSGTGRVENCRFTENRLVAAGYYGAGGYFGAGVRVRNCLFTKNVATSYAGGVGLAAIGNDGGEFTACTVVSNRAATGGGLYLSGTNNVLLNSVIYSNTATTSNDLYLATDQASNTLTYNCVPVTLSGAGNITAYPKFIDPVGGDWHLNSGSPCVNAGINQAWMGTAVDLDGCPRIDRFSGKVDMGCYEFLHQGTLFNFQ